MKLIVITSPSFLENEAKAISTLFEEGLEILHLRKPEASANEIRRLLDSIPAVYHPHIVTHDHFELLNDYDLMGIHLNRRNPQVPALHTGSVSCSCHSLEEVKQRKDYCQYVFLSPIYNSLSKPGYKAAFQLDELTEAAQNRIIDAKVMALGGISIHHLQEVKNIGFGGAVLLGDVWKHQVNELPDYFHLLKQQII